MAEVVAKAIEMASPLLEQRAHTLTVDVPRHGLRVDGDPTRLGQVISNLLTNAAKYTPPGGTIAVARRGRSTTRSCCRVRDTGIGIAAEVLPRVFDLFVQERQALDRSQGGLGHRADDRAQPGRAARRRRCRRAATVREAAASSSSACRVAGRAQRRSPARRRRRQIARRSRRARRRAHPRRRRQRGRRRAAGRGAQRQGLRHARRARRADGAAHRRRVSRRTSRFSTSGCR